MERRTFLTSALGAAPAALGASPLLRVQEAAIDGGAALLAARVATVRSLHARWRVALAGGAKSEGAGVLEGPTEAFYRDGQYRVLYERPPFAFTELCIGALYVKTVRRIGSKELLKTEYEGRTPAHKTPDEMLKLLLPAPDPEVTTQVLARSATFTTFSQRAGRHRYVVDANTNLLMTCETADRKGVVRWRRSYDGYLHDVAPAFPARVTETRFSPDGIAALVLTWTFDAVAINGEIADEVFDWRRR
jgi:hypothetical protein